MQTQRLKTIDHPLYARARALYDESFPRCERRDAAAQARILSDPAYHFELLLDGGDFVGLMLWWALADGRYLEHLCTLPALRNRRYGRAALSLLQAAGEPVVLEIDPPEDALSQRRARFYARSGFLANDFPHIQPPYRPGDPETPLVVLSWPRRLTAAEYAAFYRTLVTRVIPQKEALS